MKHSVRWLGAAVLSVMAAACGEGANARQGASPTAPRLTGVTTHVTVSCPATMEYGTTGTCTAFGYDATNTFTNSNVTSWSSSNTSLATITSAGAVTAGSTSGTVTITAVIDGISGSTTISIVPPYVAPSVSISGPGLVQFGNECLYTANVSNGRGPFTYSWTTSGPVVGGSDGANGFLAQATLSSGRFTLTVTVTDSTSHTATASKTVNISSTAPICF
jgi:hypothetical protein